MKYIDTHTHLYSEEYESTDEEILKAFEEGVDRLFICSSDLESSKKAIDIASRYDNVFAIVGFHPSDLKGYGDDEYNELKELAKNNKVVAIGEIGLDYHWDTTTKEEQREGFIRQLNIAKELNLPISVHCREADQDTFDIIKEYYNSSNGGIIHAYSGSLELAKEYIKMNFVFGVGGVVTFKNAKRIKEVVAGLDLDYFVSETDCPYLTPTPHRGELNHSYYIPLIVKEIANMKNVDEQLVIDKINNNVNRLFFRSKND